MISATEESDFVALLAEMGPDGIALIGKLLEVYNLGKAAGEVIGHERGFAEGVAATRKQIVSEIAGVKVEPLVASTPSVPPETTIEAFRFSAHTHNCLWRDNIHTIADLVAKREQDLLDIRNLGQQRLNEVKAALAANGYSLAPDTPFDAMIVLRS